MGNDRKYICMGITIRLWYGGISKKNVSHAAVNKQTETAPYKSKLYAYLNNVQDYDDKHCILQSLTTGIKAQS